MADDARISTAFPNHPKTKMVRKRLGYEGGWALLCLLLWVADNKPDGDLKGMRDEEIEVAVDWNGTEGLFVSTLRDVRFIDGESGSYKIHDWFEHNPWAATRGIRKAAAQHAAEVRWAGVRDALKCEAHAERIQTAQKGNAHHPTQPIPLTTTSIEPPENGGSQQLAGTLPLNNGSEHPILRLEVCQWKELYPAVDVMQELRNMKGWLMANPTRRKTKTGIKKFINNWLARCQNEGRSHGKDQRTGVEVLSKQAARNQSNTDKLAKSILGIDVGRDVATGSGQCEVRIDGERDRVLEAPGCRVPG